MRGGLPAIEVTLRTPRGAGGDRADRRRGRGRRRRRGHGHDDRSRSTTRSPPARASSSRRARRRPCSTACRPATSRSCPERRRRRTCVALIERGITHAKLFPAEVVGGVEALKAFARAVPAAALLPDGRDQRRQRAGLPRAAQRGVRRRARGWSAATSSASRRWPARPPALAAFREEPALVEARRTVRRRPRPGDRSSTRTPPTTAADQLLEGGSGDERVPERAARLARGEAQRGVLVDRDDLGAVVPARRCVMPMHHVGNRRHRRRTNVQIDPDSCGRQPPSREPEVLVRRQRRRSRGRPRARGRRARLAAPVSAKPRSRTTPSDTAAGRR